MYINGYPAYPFINVIQKKIKIIENLMEKNNNILNYKMIPKLNVLRGIPNDIKNKYHYNYENLFEIY